ncbi:Fimbrial assembly protein (PilN) [Tepidimonas alkaliphilus]|uniref:Fimbrial assembly protein (PilN) n=1 Tax=Tepidimonas alkaliphilus TaxID=2588942 RepID=A0A554W9H1_9BURK|nr:PilN domain-containing protein [Tepidimonas alkaliphilus]TSE20218.1 Fimbrial assembly protein (PilN) [Tepidimonas alkaliphilus]
MVAINLLPHRQWERKRRREAFYRQLGLAVALSLAVAGLIYFTYQTRLEAQEARNRVLQDEIAQLDAQIREIATLQEELGALKARQNAVESLQADRNLPVHLLNELVRQLPDGVALRSIKQEGAAITIAGVAQSQERVSELLRNLGNASPWLQQPQLIEIVGATMNLNPGGQRRVFNFSLRVTQSKGTASNASTTSGPAAGPT